MMNAKKFIDNLSMRRMSSQGPKRHMKYPYTFTAKIMQFPYKFYVQNNWAYRYYIFAVIACIPVFKYCSNIGNFFYYSFFNYNLPFKAMAILFRFKTIVYIFCNLSLPERKLLELSLIGWDVFVFVS